MVSGVIDVRVRKHDGMVLRSAQSLHPLAVRGAPLTDVPRDRGRPDERDRCDVRVVEDGVDRLLVTVNDVEHSIGEPGFGPQLGDDRRRGWIAFARLEDERVAAGDGDRVHPQRHHDREVERRDSRYDTERLPERVHVDPGRHLVGVLALEQAGDAARVLHDFQSALHLTPGIGDDLAVLVGDHFGELAGALVNQLAEIEQDLRSLGQGRLRPPFEGRRSGPHRLVHVIRAGQDDLGLLFAGRRVPYRTASTRRPGARRAADPVVDRPHGRPPDSVYRNSRGPARRPCSVEPPIDTVDGTRRRKPPDGIRCTEHGPPRRLPDRLG